MFSVLIVFLVRVLSRRPSRFDRHKSSVLVQARFHFAANGR